MEILWYKYPLNLFHSSTCFAISHLLLQNQCLSLRQLLAGMRVYHQCIEKWSWFCLWVCFNCSPFSKPYSLSQELICKLTFSVIPKIVVRAEWIHPKLFTGHLLCVTSPATVLQTYLPRKLFPVLAEFDFRVEELSWERTKQNFEWGRLHNRQCMSRREGFQRTGKFSLKIHQIMRVIEKELAHEHFRRTACPCAERNGYDIDLKGYSIVPNNVVESDTGHKQHVQKLWCIKNLYFISLRHPWKDI